MVKAYDDESNASQKDSGYLYTFDNGVLRFKNYAAYSEICDKRIPIEFNENKSHNNFESLESIYNNIHTSELTPPSLTYNFSKAKDQYQLT